MTQQEFNEKLNDLIVNKPKNIHFFGIAVDTEGKDAIFIVNGEFATLSKGIAVGLIDTPECTEILTGALEIAINNMKNNE